MIVIDDIGQSLEYGRAAIELPGPLTFAFLPYTPHATVLSQLAEATGKDVILHAPMANIAGIPIGKGGLYPHQSESELKNELKKSLDSLPLVLGLNNHMGSLLTQNEQSMRWVMEVAAERDLFFLDSRTTPNSVAFRMAQKQGIPSLTRDIFLDHEITYEFVDQQFSKAIELAQEKGHAIIIGHPYPVTIDYLATALPRLDELGIQLVAASAFLQQQSDIKALQEWSSDVSLQTEAEPAQALSSTVTH
ncbi:divergent polysaccharide deacetylase family protein [Nitrincola nitratireducens]|uniref:divergent polysaccharide deacetylase family protein n=1 Tax=Nitrincola nitratireducens TaxID=1229521 RepID=UPI0004BCC13C|nr:divergent polysaccharide deacetylase family protein [Nitrincola nitratireducens]